MTANILTLTRRLHHEIRIAYPQMFPTELSLIIFNEGMVAFMTSLTGVLIALASFSISFYRFRKDKPEIKFNYDILTNDDRSKTWIRIFYVNVGRRATLIKHIGYFDWTIGNFIAAGGDVFDKVLKEGEAGTYKKEFPRGDLWRIKTFVIEDHFGNRWVLKKSQMSLLYESAHNTDPNHNQAKRDRAFKKFQDQQVSSMEKYLKFLKRNRLTNDTDLVKRYISTRKPLL